MSQTHTVRGRATSVHTHNGKTDVVYHDTIVVSFDQDKIVLNTGGWRTVTTKARMNQASNQFDLRYYVTQKDFDWFVGYRGRIIPFESQYLELDRNIGREVTEHPESEQPLVG